MSKFIQIAGVMNERDGFVYALDEGGEVWQYRDAYVSPFGDCRIEAGWRKLSSNRDPQVIHTEEKSPSA